jgi:hypothetical protein
MPTLGDLKARIFAETNRDDLGPGEALEAMLELCIGRAIEHFSGEEFWFMRSSGSRSTTAGVATVALPDAVRVAETVAHQLEPLGKVPLASIEHLQGFGAPARWAANGDNIQLWPVPDAAYPLDIFGLAQIDAPTADGQSTVWTNEAYDLIAARTRFLLFRDVFRDVEGTQLAAQAEGEAMTRLKRETRRRCVTPLRSTGDEPWTTPSTYNANRSA